MRHHRGRWWGLGVSCPSKGQSLSWWEKSQGGVAALGPQAWPGAPQMAREAASWVHYRSDHTAKVVGTGCQTQLEKLLQGQVSVQAAPPFRQAFIELLLCAVCWAFCQTVPHRQIRRGPCPRTSRTRSTDQLGTCFLRQAVPALPPECP